MDVRGYKTLKNNIGMIYRASRIETGAIPKYLQSRKDLQSSEKT
jgi:hypothetical protein